MKFMPPFSCMESLNAFLSSFHFGESAIRGSLDTLSCKKTRAQRKLSLELENEILEYINECAEGDAHSSVGYLSCRRSRKVLIDLVLALDLFYPEYGFRPVRTDKFLRDVELNAFKKEIEDCLPEASWRWSSQNDGIALSMSMTNAIDEVVKINECEIYSYIPDADTNTSIYREVTLWALNYFFYNKKLKRVVCFRCHCIPQGNSEEESIDEDSES